MFPGVMPIPQHFIVFAKKLILFQEGAYTFFCPYYNTLKVTLRGPGGGGGTITNTYGGAFVIPQTASTDAGDTSFNTSLIAFGGKRGTDGSKNGSGTVVNGVNGANGGMSGQDSGSVGGGWVGGDGGSDAVPPGGPTVAGGTGGWGGNAVKTYRLGDLTPGVTYDGLIGIKGKGAKALVVTGNFPLASGDDGQNGVAALGAAEFEVG